MGMVSYGVTRNVDAEDEQGMPVKIALVVIKHERGGEQRLAIREDLIMFAGESMIEKEVMRAAGKV